MKHGDDAGQKMDEPMVGGATAKQLTGCGGSLKIMPCVNKKKKKKMPVGCIDGNLGGAIR